MASLISSFVALNIEPEDDTEEEVDDTKEIQIEEALKLYQTALKLHSQGPIFYGQAAEAYDALFRSEIFTYPESLSQSKRYELFGDLFVGDDSLEVDANITSTAGSTAATDGAPSTLPQILYLSYKNHGQFLLDCLKSRASYAPGSLPRNLSKVPFNATPTASTASASLVLFSEALERDDTDVELWRRISRISDAIGSRRIARFCLETVLDKDGSGPDAWPEPLSLEEAFAREDLIDLIRKVEGSLSKTQVPASQTPQKRISSTLRRHVDPCPYLPSPLELPRQNGPSQSIDVVVPSQLPINVLNLSWAGLGKAILQQMLVETQGVLNPSPGTSYFISLPTDGPSTGYPRHLSQNSDYSMDVLKTLPEAACDSGRRNIDTVMGGVRGENIIPRNERVNHNASDLTTSEIIKRNEFASTSAQGNINSSDQIMKGSGNETASPDCNMPMVSLQEHIGNNDNEQKGTSNSMCLPTRKRSSDSAGLQEPADGGRVRSKRIRARGSILESGADEDTAVADMTKHYEGLLQPYADADNWMFGVLWRLLENIEVGSLGPDMTELKEALSTFESDAATHASTSNPDAQLIAAQDFRTLLGNWNNEMSNALLRGEGLGDLMGGARNSGLTAFLEHAKRGSQKASTKSTLVVDDGLYHLTNQINQTITSMEEIAIIWIEELLGPSKGVIPDAKGESPAGNEKRKESRYIKYFWPEELKEMVVRILVGQDEFIYAELQRRNGLLDQHMLEAQTYGADLVVSAQDEMLPELVQTIFELHLDIYGRITNPSSEVTADIRTVQRDRLGRWATLASDVMSKRPYCGHADTVKDTLTLRYLWSSVMYTDLIDPTSRDHVILCLQDLKRILHAVGGPMVELQNNAIMPEISTEAAEREISRLTTMDFFLGIFGTENSDPVAVIESLEPILEGSDLCKDVVVQDAVESSTASEGTAELTLGGLKDPSTPREAAPSQNAFDAQMQQMSHFLAGASSSLRLFLWRKLRNAYETIDYPTKVFSCCLRCIELIMNDLSLPVHLEDRPAQRQLSLVRCLRTLDDLIIKALTLALNNTSSFECLDEEHLRTSMRALAKLARLLHIFSLYEDSVRVGQARSPDQPDRPSTASQGLAMNKLREMQIRIWTLQYTVLKEAVSQTQPQLASSNEHLAEYLRSVHYALGLRSYCKLANKIYLRFMKTELFALGPTEGWEYEMSQVLHDLHGITVSSATANLPDHGCPLEPLDRRAAIQILDLVLSQARRISIKDLPKSELRSTIEKMQQVIGIPKQTSALLLNKRVINAYLKSPINPISLYRSLQGIGGLSGVSVHGEMARIAEKGWYFLLGNIALTRFRSQKRVSAGPTDDLDIAISFFRQDLDLGMDKWETWYRLGQAYDTKIEEDVMWTADKINNHKPELNALQRNTIHCYTMATAIAIRCADASYDTAAKTSDLYTDFGLRVYASSREPFSMEAFNLNEFTKYFSGEKRGLYQHRPFRALNLYPAWNLAGVLFRRALIEKPQRWVNSYMLGKCLWKMHSCEDHVRGKAQSPDIQHALNVFAHAIRCLPGRKDSKQDPILEPHYKLVSVVHKLVQKRQLQPERGCHVLKATSYARKVPVVHDAEDWEGYILLVLKALRSADKANWHHRMVARAAHVIYDDSPSEVVAAAGAKHEFTQQIFTKTMSIQVWRPENERAGRHFVYTSRYVKFFVGILSQLNDRTSLEALAKRIRKRSQDFVDHAKVWQEVCMAYLLLLRRSGSIPEGSEDMAFKFLAHEPFLLNATRLEAWAHLPSTSSPHLDLLREAIELKRLNNGLMKGTHLDDLVGDMYARLYETIVPDLVAKSNDEENRDRMRVNHLLMSTDGPTGDAPSPEPTSLSGDPTVVRPPRFKGVGRREIQRKAEAIISKPPPAPIAAKPPKTFAEPLPQQLQEQGYQVNATATFMVKEEAARDAGASSVPGSVHDSADDESELSDLEDIPEETAGAKPIFANLVSSAKGGDTPAAEGEDYGECEGEGEGEGEGQGENEDEDEEQAREEQDVPRSETSATIA